MKTLALGVMILLAASSMVSAQQIFVTVDDETVIFTTTGPQVVDGRVLVPLRGVLEKMGAYVDWVAATRTVTAFRGTTDVQLQVGSRTAMVNSRAMQLDVPAMIIGGSTMVPLRFVAEAMGADVRWDAATRTVMIYTGEALPPPPTDPPAPPPPGTPAGITSFTHNAQGWLRAGDTINVTLTGTVAGSAVFQIPGVVDSISMNELPAGTYTGSWTVPSNRELAIENASVLGRLTVEGRELMIQAGNPVSIDTVSPRITSPMPEPDSSAAYTQPGISVALSDTGSGIDTRTLTFLVNGQNVTAQSTITPGFATYRPALPLSSGQNSARVTVADRAGNTTTLDWSFLVQDVADVITSFRFEPTGVPEPGDVLTVHLEGQAGGQASFSLGETIKDLPMTEIAGGQYRGEYTVRRTDELSGLAVTGVLVVGGQRYTVNAETRIGGASVRAPSIPVITAPTDGSRVTSPLTVRGTAGAGTNVHVRVDFSTELIGPVANTGTIGQQTVQADQDGNYVAGPFNLDLLIRGRNTRYTVHAYAENETGEVSEQVSVVVTR